MKCLYDLSDCTGCMSCIEEAVPVFECVNCGAVIYEGDMYYNAAGEPYCECCVEYKTAERKRD